MMETDSDIANRIAIERLIVRKLLRLAKAAGYAWRHHDGCEFTQPKPTMAVELTWRIHESAIIEVEARNEREAKKIAEAMAHTDPSLAHEYYAERLSTEAVNVKESKQ